MNLKRALADKLDARYARRSTVARLRREVRQIHQQLAQVDERLTELASKSGNHSHVCDATARELSMLRPRVNEAHRFAIESARAVESLLEVELQQRQAIDAITGVGR